MAGWRAATIAGVLSLACSGETIDGTRPSDAAHGDAAPSGEPPTAQPHLDAAPPEASTSEGAITDAPDADGSCDDGSCVTGCDETRVLTGDFKLQYTNFLSPAYEFTQTSIGNIDGVTTIEGSLMVSDVSDLTFLRCLRRVSGDLWIGQETVCVGSACSRAPNPVLTSLEDLRQLEEVGGRLTVANNPSLVSLNALSALRNVGSLWVKECPLLTDLGGLEGITSVDELQVTENDALLTFSGLENLTTAETVIVRRNPNLTSLSGLSSLTLVRSTLSIAENASLPDCEAEALATQVGKNCTSPDTSYLMCTGICTCDGNDGSGTCP